MTTQRKITLRYRTTRVKYNSPGVETFMSPRPSVVIQRNVNGNSEMLIPSRYLGGILPNCLTENFRFWRDEQLHAVIAERKLDADETWFGYELEIMVKASLNSSLSSEAKSNGGGNMFQKGLLRTKSKVRVVVVLFVKTSHQRSNHLNNLYR